MWFCKVVFLGNDFNTFEKKKITWNKWISNLLKKVFYQASGCPRCLNCQYLGSTNATERFTASLHQSRLYSDQPKKKGMVSSFIEDVTRQFQKDQKLQVCNWHHVINELVTFCWSWIVFFFSGKHKEVSRWLPKTRTSRIATENSWEVRKYCTVKQRKKDAIFCLTLLITFLFKEKNWSGKLENGTTKENAVRIQRKSRKGLF